MLFWDHLRHFFTSLKKKNLLKTEQKIWETKWSNPDFFPFWADRGIAPEIIDALETGWLPKTGRVLDIGCGKGFITDWFAERGYDSLGIDIAESAIKQAQTTYDFSGKKLEFLVVNPCDSPPPSRSYNILIDRGCLHLVPTQLAPDFVRNISSVCADDARMMLFMKTSRKSLEPEHAEAEFAAHLQWVKGLFSGLFEIEKVTSTSLAPPHRPKSRPPLPGLLYWLRKIPNSASGHLPG